jgi:hypothetical protein
MIELMIPVTYKLDLHSCSNKIIKKNIKKSYANYFILQYDKNYICIDDTKNSIYRSVVFSNPENKILSFSPVKTIPTYVFMERYPIINDEIVIQEHIEGVMINLFYDHRICRWKIATKGAIGGNYGFINANNNNETFYDMFLETLCANKDETLNEIEIIKILPKTFSYTFILQHPKNIISKPVKRPHCYLVAVYSINNIENEVEYIPSTIYENWSMFHDINGIIEFPKQYYTTQYESITKIDYGINYIITNVRTGEQCKVSSFYRDLLKKTIHIDSSIQYQYFCMRRIGKIKEYIKMFPKHKKAFFDIQDDYEYFVSTIHELYCNCYIYKTICLHDIEPKYFTHIYKIHHSIYLASLSNKKINKKIQKIYRKTVLKYFDNIDPRELLFILSSDKRDL